MSLDQDLPQPNGPDTCIGFHEMTTSKHCVMPNTWSIENVTVDVGRARAGVGLKLPAIGQCSVGGGTPGGGNSCLVDNTTTIQANVPLTLDLPSSHRPHQPHGRVWTL